MNTCGRIILCIVLSTSTWSTGAFSTPCGSKTNRATGFWMAMQANDGAAVDRKTFLQTAGFSTLALLFTSVPAHADVTSKVASSAALRNVKLVQKKFSGLEEVVDANDFSELRGSLRAAPISDVRKNMSILVKGGEDGPDAQKLSDQYRNFIVCLEKMDGNAGVAMRGKKLSDGEFVSSYKATVEALNTFLETAQAAADIPLQPNE